MAVRFDLTKALLLACTVFSALVVAYAVTSFQSLTLPVKVMLGIIATMATFSFGALFVGREQRIMAIMLLGAVLTSFYAAEWYFQHFGMDALDQARVQRARSLDVDFDRRSRNEVVLDLRSDGLPDAVPTISSSAITYLGYGAGIPMGTEKILPLAGVSGRTTVLCNELGDFTIYQSDERGFNNPPGSWAAAVQVALVGDSFTHGSCVEPRDHWVTRVRERFPNTLNLGIGGNDLLTIYASLKEYLPDLRPEVVIWAHYEGNDLQIGAELNSPVLLEYWRNDEFRQGLASRQSAIDAELDRIVDDVLAEVGFDAKKFLKLYHLRTQFGIGDRPAGQSQALQRNPELVTLFDEVLAKANDLVSGWGGKLYLVYLPQSTRFAPASTAYSGEPLSPYYQDVSSTAAKLGIPLIDLVPRFLADADPMSHFPFGLHGHYNAKGYSVVAAQVLASLEATSARSDGDRASEQMVGSGTQR